MPKAPKWALLDLLVNILQNWSFGSVSKNIPLDSSFRSRYLGVGGLWHGQTTRCHRVTVKSRSLQWQGTTKNPKVNIVQKGITWPSLSVAFALPLGPSRRMQLCFRPSATRSGRLVESCTCHYQRPPPPPQADLPSVLTPPPPPRADSLAWHCILM